MLEVGVKAPDFTLKDKDGKEVALSSFRGKKVVHSAIAMGGTIPPAMTAAMTSKLPSASWAVPNT